MSPDEFIRTVREEFINSLTDEYADSFNQTQSDKCKDLSVKPMIELWHKSDKETKDILKMFIRLGAQNSISSVLSSLDNISGTFSEEFTLLINEKESINGDLLDTFWEQEEIDGFVNVKT